MVTIKEIARECNVSAATVSNILNGKANVGAKTKERVMKVIEQREYQPDHLARSLRKGKTNTIGVIAEDIGQFSAPPILEGIMRCCEREGYQTMIQNLCLYAKWGDRWFDDESIYQDTLDAAVQKLLAVKADGLLYVAGHSRYIGYFAGESFIPTVMVYAFSQSVHTPCVVNDDEKGGYDMMGYLLSMGHRRIGILAGREDNLHTIRRLQGCQKALAEAGISYEPQLVRYGNWERESGSQMAESLLRAERDVTAVFCMNDKMAGGVYDYLQERGLCAGEDISVAGYDNQIFAAYCSPPITTMEIDLYEIGTRGVQMLIEKLKSPDEGRKEVILEEKIPGRLIERKSVKRIAQ